MALQHAGRFGRQNDLLEEARLSGLVVEMAKTRRPLMQPEITGLYLQWAHSAASRGRCLEYSPNCA